MEVNTGEVVVGGASEGSFATGDTMNVAARLEQAASPRQVLAGERTAAAVAQAFVFGDAMVVEAKGKPGGVACRPVLGVAPSVVSRVVATPHVFVGRQSDLEALRAAYNQVCSHASVQLVTIVGDPGIGKSALLGQFWEDLGEAIPQPIKLVGRCLAYGRGITFWALSEILKAEFGISERDSPEQIRRKLAKHPALSWTLGVDVPEGIHPLAMRDRLHQAWVDFIEELAADGPLVIVIEDMHWAEEPLLELLETVVLDCHARVLASVTGRPELSGATLGRKLDA